jgi:hypothetical protein
MMLMPPEPAPKLAPTRLRLLLIPLAALIAVMPLMHHGCSCGHDFDFHLLNWMEAANQFSHGNLHPHWAFTPAFNAGEPRFVFYPPLSWYLGALLGLLLTHLPGISAAAGWNATPILFTWIALTTAGFAMHRLAREFAGANAALLAAALYIVNPYMLFTAYERTAYAELLAAAVIPLLLRAILHQNVTIPRLALPVALLWLTNAPAAVMGSYALAFLAAIRIISTYRSGVAPDIASEGPPTRHRDAFQLALKTIAATALGFAIAAFYIVPAEYERRFVQIAMATITGMRIDQNFLFEHTGTSGDALLHDQVLHTASVIAVLMLGATAIALAAVFLARKPKPHAHAFPALTLAILAAGIAFLLTPPSLPLWNHLPQAVFLQFTWRLLAILAPILALTVAVALTRISLSLSVTTIVAVVLAVALSHPAYHVFQQPCDPEDTATARLALFHSDAGTDPTDEYTPATADNDALTPNNPPWWLAASATSAPPAGAEPGPAPMHLSVAAPQAEDLILNLRDYPAWRISVNGALQSARATRADGLIAILIPAGPSTIDIHYAHTADQTAGDAIALIALTMLLITMRRNGQRSR